jgi:hypothetical protein
MTITLLHNGKGQQHDLNNWRGICMKEMTVKLVSSITDTLLLTVFDTSNVTEHLTTIGCQEAIHTLRATLALRRLHVKEKSVPFVDLVRAYDTVNHDLLFKMMKKYGIPTELMDVLRRMYANCEIKISAEKEKRLIDYLNGVQQGDNVAPVLFIFLMLAVSQTLKEKWNFTTPEYRNFEENKWGKIGRLKNQKHKTRGT